MAQHERTRLPEPRHLRRPTTVTARRAAVPMAAAAALAISAAALVLWSTAAVAQDAEDIRQAVLDAAPSVQDPRSADVEIQTHVVEPSPLEPTPERLSELSMPPGFTIDVFAENLGNPRMLAVADDGTVYVTRRTFGDVLMLRDTDGDGRADEQRRVASRPDMHGIAIDGDTVYLVTVEDIYRAQRQDDGSLGELERLVDDLPDGGQHPNRTIAVGPDGKLYVSVGSTCNACGETSQESATILRVEPDGSHRSIHASGLRNTIGFGFHPQTGVLYGMDHGIDWLGDDAQPEELNLITEGSHYGWPYIYADGRFNSQDDPPEGITMEQWAEQSVDPIGLYVAHAAPMQLVFYRGEQFPDEHRGDAFVAMRGSWNRRPPSGYEIVRIHFENGEPSSFEPLVTGFLTETDDGWGYIARPTGIAEANDGSLLVADDANGTIYRVAYDETAAADASAAAGRLEATNAGGAAFGMLGARARQAESGAPADTSSELAIERFEAPGTLDVSSQAFASGQPIPAKHAADQENISPALEWSAGPDGTQAYALVVEDPDAAEDPPHVHWLAYDIPADVTALREALPGTPRLPDPEGMLQGSNDNGKTGYSGMKPPAGDPPHEYHFQVFALDSRLDLPHGADRAALLDAMQGRVLAGGELVGTYRRGEDGRAARHGDDGRAAAARAAPARQ